MKRDKKYELDWIKEIINFEIDWDDTCSSIIWIKNNSKHVTKINASKKLIYESLKCLVFGVTRNEICGIFYDF